MAAYTILIVDDSPSARRQILELLEADEAEYACFEAENGAVALKLALTTGPDLIISDYNMPVLDGHAFCRFVRQNSRLQSIPFIMVTSRNERDSRLALIESGVDDYLTKPVDPRELIGRVKSLLRLRKASQELEQKHRELKAVQARELLTQKTAFAGRLAIGIAHEFNNPIACIASNLEYLDERLREVLPLVKADKKKEWDEFIEETFDILNQSQHVLKRMTSTVAELQALRSEDAADLRAAHRVNTILDEALAVIGKTVKTVTENGVSPAAIERVEEDACEVLCAKADLVEAFALVLHFFIRRIHEQKATGRIAINVAIEHPDSVIRFDCPTVTLGKDEIERLFDPDLIVGNDHRVILTVDLSVCAGYIARNGGTIRAIRGIGAEGRGATIEARFRPVPKEALRPM